MLGMVLVETGPNGVQKWRRQTRVLPSFSVTAPPAAFRRRFPPFHSEFPTCLCVCDNSISTTTHSEAPAGHTPFLDLPVHVLLLPALPAACCPSLCSAEEAT